MLLTVNGTFRAAARFCSARRCPMLYYKATAGCGVGFLCGSQCASAPPPLLSSWAASSSSLVYLTDWLGLTFS